MSRRVLRIAAWATAMVAVVLTGCGGLGSGGEGAPGRQLTLLLDRPWSAEHAGIALADERGYASGEGIALRVRRASGDADPARLLEREEVDAAVMSINALGLLRRGGRDLVGVAAVTQRPLTGILARAGIQSPRELEGRAIGSTGHPGEEAIARSMVQADGGDAGSLEFQPVSERPAAQLAGGSVAAVTGPLGVLGPALVAEGLRPQELSLADYGGPSYPELLLVVKRRALDDYPGALRGLVATLARGYREAQVDPESAATALTEREEGLERALLLEQIEEVAPTWTAGAEFFGQLRERRLRAWARWAVDAGLLDRRPRLERAFAPGLLNG